MGTNDLVSLESLLKDLKSAQHDLNNLLNNILTAADLLKDNFSENCTIEELANQIQNNSILASKIISQIIPQNENTANSFSKLNLNELIMDTIKLVDSKSVRIKTFLPKQETFIIGDYTNLQRVLLNLIENAKDAIKEELSIQIKLETSIIIDSKNFILLTITDNGSGIKKEHLDRIFDAGFTTKESSTQRGFGLSIVNEIVKSHKGLLYVNSKINEGTTFKIYFPDKNFNNHNFSFDNKIVILAEDDNFQREVMSDLLKSMKLNVFTATNGTEALDLFYSIKPDLLLIDDKMPEMTGLECVSKIRENDNLAQIVLITGSNQTENYLNDNSIRVLNKPYNFDEIKLLLSELL